MSNPILKYKYYLSSILKLLLGIQEKYLVLRTFLFRPNQKINHISKIHILKTYGLSFYIRGRMDIWSIKETFLDRFYELYGFKINDNWNILDVGAGIGDYAIFAAYQHPDNIIYAYEPFPESFKLLEDNLALNEIANVHCFQQAISGQSGMMTLDLSGGEPLQIRSYGEFAKDSQTNPATPNPSKLQVSSLSLGDVFLQLNLSHCDLIKMDCEGAEYDMLFNTAPEILQRIGRIVMEYHDGVTIFAHNDLVEYLQNNQFRVETFPNTVHADLGYLRAVNMKVLHAIPG